MLDWDEDHEVRIFRLAGLGDNAFEDCVQILRAAEEPNWPLWFPFARTSPDQTVREGNRQQLDDVLAEAKPAELLVAWQGYGESILAAKQVAPRALAQAPDWFSQQGNGTTNWFSILGLDKVRT
jgi:hypothetical protein